ncbi:Hypothetical protein D9617_4g003730 [Elsinoe fawcettii]|nr:Hypothetical protein D9617_4g003730 [Elsinoe fawcettii]
MKSINPLMAVMALGTIRNAAAQDLSTCIASVNILTVFETITSIQTVAEVTSTMILTETVTVVTTATTPATGTAPSNIQSFTYLPTTISDTTSTITDAISTTSAFPMITLIVPPTRTANNVPGPGTSGWNITSTTVEGSTINEATAFTATSESFVARSIFGRAAQVNNIVFGESTEIGADSRLYAGPRRYSLGTLNGPINPADPPFPTSAIDSSSTVPLCGTGTAPCNEDTAPATTLSTRTTFLPTGTRSASEETDCGEIGDFRFGWDDLPRFITNLTDITRAVPIFSPYRHFQFSQGYAYAPLPETPFEAVSPPHLAVFITNETGAENVPSPGFVRPGELGAGRRASNQAYWFNAYSAYLGCDNTDSLGCMYEISGYVYDSLFRAEILAYQSNVTVPACPALENCLLTFVDFPLDMRGLSGFQIRAFVGEEQRIWFMDELALGWWDNSCEAGQIRARSRKRSTNAW